MTDRHFRAWPRRRSRQPVLLRWSEPPSAEPKERRARLVDVGLGGVGVSVDQPPPAGVPFELVLHPPHRWDPLVLPARVVWSKGARAGVAFVPAGERDVFDWFEFLGAETLEG